MLVDGDRNRIGFRHRDLNLLDHLNGIRLLHLHRIRFFHSVGDFLLSDLRDYFVDRYLDLLLDGNVDGIGLRYLKPDHVRHLDGHGMRNGKWHLLDHVHGHVLGDLRICGGSVVMEVASTAAASAATSSVVAITSSAETFAAVFGGANQLNTTDQ